MTFIGSDPETIVSFWFNPALLDTISERRSEDVKRLLSEVGRFDSSQVEPGLKSGLARIRRLIQRREQEAAAAKAEAATLRAKVAKQGITVGRLRRETEAYQRQTLFLQSVTSLDAKRLLSFHHEIALNANTVENYLGRCFKLIRDGGSIDGLTTFLEKISLANRKITAIAQFATKANFKADTQKELTDLPTFVEQYIANVAREYVGSGIGIDVQNTVTQPFEIRARRIELSILVDNIISNSVKAQARSMTVVIDLTAKNLLCLSFQDDGRGLADSISRPSDIFSMGLTTTSGSGLGLYHVDQIVKSLGGAVQAIPRSPRGLEVRVDVPR
jgi:signal transduction histidine kinase